jgi:hypothetical protein
VAAQGSWVETTTHAEKATLAWPAATMLVLNIVPILRTSKTLLLLGARGCQISMLLNMPDATRADSGNGCGGQEPFSWYERMPEQKRKQEQSSLP